MIVRSKWKRRVKQKYRYTKGYVPSGPGSDLIDVWTWLWQCGQVIVIGCFPYLIGPCTITTCCGGGCTGGAPPTYPGACIGGCGYAPKIKFMYQFMFNRVWDC